MSSAADRQRAYRQRVADGCRIVSVRVSPELEQVLADAGLLRPSWADDRDAVAAAVQRMLDALAAEARYT